MICYALFWQPSLYLQHSYFWHWLAGLVEMGSSFLVMIMAMIILYLLFVCLFFSTICCTVLLAIKLMWLLLFTCLVSVYLYVQLCICFVLVFVYLCCICIFCVCIFLHSYSSNQADVAPPFTCLVTNEHNQDGVLASLKGDLYGDGDDKICLVASIKIGMRQHLQIKGIFLPIMVSHTKTLPRKTIYIFRF